MFKQSKETRKHQYEMTMRACKEDGLEAGIETNFHHYSTQMGYLEAALVGGKLTTGEVEQRAKDLYKAWKDTNKSIRKECGQ